MVDATIGCVSALPRNTAVKAPENGIVTKVEQLQVGDYVTASTPVFSLVSDRVWVEANFKETELTNMRPGQEATVAEFHPGLVAGDDMVIGHDQPRAVPDQPRSVPVS